MDTNYESYWESIGLVVTNSDFVRPSSAAEFADILKLSNCRNTQISGVELRDPNRENPRENWIDAVRGSGLLVENCVIGSAEVAAVTIKGAFDGYTFRACSFDRCPKYEIELGQFDDYWTPGRAPTRHGVFTCCARSDGRKIRIICWDAEVPAHDSGAVKVTKVPVILWYPYFLIRYGWARLKRTLNPEK